MGNAELQRALFGGRSDEIARELTSLMQTVDTGNDKQTKTTSQVAASGTTNVTFTSPVLATNSAPLAYTLRVYARQTSPQTNARIIASVPLAVYRNASASTVELGTVVSEIGTGIALTGGAAANVSAAVSTDGSTITVTIANAAANGYTYVVELSAQ